MGSGFLLFRIIKTGKDDRFDDKRDKFFPFLGFWVFQMLWVWTVSLPVTVLNSPNVTQYPQPDFGTGRDIAGVVLWSIGIIMESVSDVQNICSRLDRVTSLLSATRGSSTGRDIQTISGKSSSNSELYDRRLPSSKRLRPWPSLQSSLRHDSRSILPHPPPNVRLWLDTSRTTWSKEAIREEQPLGGILSLLEPYEHFDSIPTTTIFETAHDPQANHLPRVSDLCF